MESVTGFAAYGALYLSVISGIGPSSPWGRRRLARLGLGGGHEALSLCDLGLAALHAWGGRPLAALGWFVPFLAPSPGTAAGAAALDILVVVTASFYLRRRLGAPLWRRVHALGYLGFAGAAVHGLLAGANAWLGAVQVMYAVTLGSAAALAVLRAIEARRGRLAPSG